MMEQGLSYIFDHSTKAVILGTFPSIKSRGECYYNHPQNIFWNIIADCFNNGNLLCCTADRYACLKKQQIGLWDVIAKCEFATQSSLDSKIVKSSIVYNDFNILRQTCPQLKMIIFSSKNAEKTFNCYLKTLGESSIYNWISKIKTVTLPSTSPANAKISINEKKRIWFECLKQIKRD